MIGHTTSEAETMACCGSPAVAVATILNGRLAEFSKANGGELVMEGPMKGGQCISANCMAWRWLAGSRRDPTGAAVPQDQWRGFCGLAGVPQ